MSVSLRDHLEWASEQTIPPLCLELVLNCGRSEWVKWIFKFQDSDHSITIRIWDMRALGPDDQTQLLANMNDVQDRDAPDYMNRLHPKLDQANLHVAVEEIACLVEWHDRYWPVELKRGRERPTVVGFSDMTAQDKSEES